MNTKALSNVEYESPAFLKFLQGFRNAPLRTDTFPGIVDINFYWPKNIQSENIYLIVQVKTELIWKEIIARLKTPIQALEDEDIIIKDGNEQIYPEGILQFIEFLLMFAA